MSDFIQQTGDTIKRAADQRTALRIEGGGTRSFYGRTVDGEVLRTSAFRGVEDYEPSELVLTARAGTPLAEVESELAENGQMLPFEPPRYGEGSTIGGVIATGLSGPCRLRGGAVRDAVLGCEIINGFGEHLAFGGQVMKNVAGYDISRLMVGALGTLGLITQVSVKVVPRPVEALTLAFDYTQGEAIEAMNRWAGRPLPVSATCHDGERLYLRLSGARTGVRSAAAELGGEAFSDPEFWPGVRDHQHGFFRDAPGLWRLSVPPATPPLDLPGATLLEWNGGLRWVATDAPARMPRDAAAAAGGHAIHFRGHDGDDVFHPLDGTRLALHRNLKRAFDPCGVLNPGRMYAGI
ncbi:MAG: glycolate oxidase subunit GlcE [Gammaproteobacteria bacterium]|nr:glycolate oxidase subunit GlcE [Gammaproteobacteria bacterium]